MAAGAKPALPWPALVGTLLAAALAPLGSTMVAVALPAIGRDLGVHDSALTQWLVATYLITSIALQSPGGKVGDRIGHRRALTLGLSLVAAGGLLGSALPNLPALAAARVLMAAGGAAIVPAAMALLRNRVPPERRTRAFGSFGACMSLAAAIGPLVGGELTQRFGWRAIFAAYLPVVALALALLPAFGSDPDEAERKPPPPFDLVGSALLGIGLALVVIALQVGRPAAALLVVGGALLVAFPFWERKAVSPVVDLALFKQASFTAGGLIVALQNLAMYALLFQTPIFFKQARQIDAREMGHALLAMTLAMMAASLVGGRLAERVGARAQAATGSLLALSGLWWFRDFSGIQTPWEIVTGLVLLGAGLGFSSAPAQAAALATVRREGAGMAAGALSTLRYVGGVAGIAALGALLRDPANPASHQAPVLVYAAALVGALCLAPALPGRRPPPPPPGR